MSGKSNPRDLELDAVRSFAWILVLVAHISMVYDVRDLSFFGLRLSTQLLKAWLGVEVFFVLSGFLITRQLTIQLVAASASGKPWPKTIATFLIRRALRTWPAFFFVILLIQFVFRHWSPYASVWLSAVSETGILAFLRNITFTSNYFGGSLLPVGWSLCIEEHFYLLLPLGIGSYLVMRPGRLPSLGAVAGTGGLLLILGMSLRLGKYLAIGNFAGGYEVFDREFYYLTHVHLDGLIVGSVLGYAAAFRPEVYARLQSRTRALGVVFIMSALYCYRYGFRAVTLQSATLLYPAAALTTASFILLATRPGWLRRTLSWRFFEFLADRTYSGYLVHPITLVMAAEIFRGRHGGGLEGLADPWSRLGAFVAIYLGVTLLGTEVVYRFVEKPFLNLRSRWAPHFQPPRA